MIELRASEICRCSRPHGTGTYYSGFEACTLCGKSITTRARRTMADQRAAAARESQFKTYRTPKRNWADMKHKSGRRVT